MKVLVACEESQEVCKAFRAHTKRTLAIYKSRPAVILNGISSVTHSLP